MLWRLHDFKGIRSADLDLRQGKVTVLTGVNSSGKSSVIQSMLLVAQSLQSGTQVVLNGPLVRLGDAQDLVREGSESAAIDLTLGLDTTEEDGFSDENLQATYSLAPADERSSLRPRRLQVEPVGSDLSPLLLSRDNSRATDVDEAKRATANLGAADALHLKSLLASEKRQLRTYVAMQGLRPVAVVQLMRPEDVRTRYRAALAPLIANSQDQNPLHGVAGASATWGPSLVREFVGLAAREAREFGDEARKLADRFSASRTGNPYSFQGEWDSLGADQRALMLDIAAQGRSKRPYVMLRITGNRWMPTQMGMLESSLSETLGDTLRALNTLAGTLDSVGERVQYLGPLRDEPRVVWNHWNELARGLPVGTRGEYSAAVLSRFGANRVAYVPPSGVEQTMAPLQHAVNEWLVYLDIGEAVSARSQGKLGVGFDLRVGGHIRDLTSVGVGVSQTLPLLVGLLSSPPDSIFIVEQPELHLHPAVQARLADFMMSARPDVALVVETHSEAFITRIRRRAAEGLIDLDDIDITFVEPQADGGSTTRILALSEFGDLSEWPVGFLSGFDLDVQAILNANVQRSLGALGE